MTAFSIPEKMFPRIESLMCVLKAHINRTLLFKGQLWKHKQKKIYMDSVSVQWSIVSRPIRIRTHVRILTSPITPNHWTEARYDIYIPLSGQHPLFYFSMSQLTNNINQTRAIAQLQEKIIWNFLTQNSDATSGLSSQHSHLQHVTVDFFHRYRNRLRIILFNFRSSFLTTSEFTSYLVSNQIIEPKILNWKKYSPNTLPQNSNVQCLPGLLHHFHLLG